jgi:transcriptional regulator with XRE-family HTH domain
MSEKEIFNAEYRQLIGSLRDARKKLGLTQAEVASKMAVNRTWVAKVEGCELRLDLLHFVRLCQVYGLRARELIGEMEA